MRELGRRLLRQEDLPQFEPVDLTLLMLMEEGGCACWVLPTLHACSTAVGAASCGCRAAACCLASCVPSLCSHCLLAAHLRPFWPLRAAGRRLQAEQDMVNSMRLSDEYLKKQRKVGRSMIGLSG